DVDQHERNCQEILEEMQTIEKNVRLGAELCKMLLANRVWIGTASWYGGELKAFMALQDFQKILGILNTDTMTKHHSIVQADLKRINDNIRDDTIGWVTDG